LSLIIDGLGARYGRYHVLRLRQSVV
jgi:hypothetical protein